MCVYIIHGVWTSYIQMSTNPCDSNYLPCFFVSIKLKRSKVKSSLLSSYSTADIGPRIFKTWKKNLPIHPTHLPRSPKKEMRPVSGAPPLWKSPSDQKFLAEKVIWAAKIRHYKNIRSSLKALLDGCNEATIFSGHHLAVQKRFCQVFYPSWIPKNCWNDAHPLLYELPECFCPWPNVCAKLKPDLRSFWSWFWRSLCNLRSGSNMTKSILVTGESVDEENLPNYALQAQIWDAFNNQFHPCKAGPVHGH